MGRLVAAAVILLIALLGMRVAGAPIFPWNSPGQAANNAPPNANNPNQTASNASPNNSSNALSRLFSQQNPSSPIQPVPQTRSTGFSSEVPTTADSNNQPGTGNQPGGNSNSGSSVPPEQPSGPVRGSW